MKLFFAILISISFNVYAQVTVNIDSVSFPQSLTGSIDSVSFFVSNITDSPIDVTVSSLKPVYSISDSSLSIPANDSSLIWIKYQPNQNVVDNNLIVISGDDSTIGVIISVNGSGKFGDNYDAATFNLYDSQLKSALTTLVSGHTSLGYNSARDKMYMEIDNKRVNGQGAPVNTLECVYTGRLAVGYTDRTNAQNNYNFNTEHTWPQSNFGEAEPMKSDLYHLFPTDVSANGIRANYPFGKVVSLITWDSAGSKLGRNTLSQIVFEPRDVHKGDVSRSMFYFLIRYPQNYGNFFTSIQENVFREWNALDAVGTIEAARNTAVASFQMKRNPFIDHPEFVDRIYSFATNNIRPVISILDVLPLKINFDSTRTNDSSLQYIYVANKGNGQLIVDSISVSNSVFVPGINNFSLNDYSHKKIPIQFNPDSVINYSATLTVYSSVGISEIQLTGIGKDNTVNIDEEPLNPVSFILEQNYPNPFNPTTIIRYFVGDAYYASPTWVTLRIYDLLGREVATLVNEQQSAGSYQVEFDAANVWASGIYYYQLRAGEFVATKKMLLLK